MTHPLIFTIGFSAQILFSARTLAQWLPSEKAGKVLSPLLFWQLSLLASFLMMAYGILREDLAIILGQCFTYGIYIRNLYYHRFWQQIPRFIRYFTVLFPAFAFGWLLIGHTNNLRTILNNADIPSVLVLWGILGQAVFTFRFVYQWLITEKNKESILPLGFWIISIIGALMIISYAIVRKDPVLLVGQLFGLLVYMRNVVLSRRQNHLIRKYEQ